MEVRRVFLSGLLGIALLTGGMCMSGCAVRADEAVTPGAQVGAEPAVAEEPAAAEEESAVIDTSEAEGPSESGAAPAENLGDGSGEGMPTMPEGY